MTEGFVLALVALIILGVVAILMVVLKRKGSLKGSVGPEGGDAELKVD